MEPKPNLKDALIKQVGVVDQLIAEAQSYNIDGQQPEFLRQIVLKLTESMLWMTQSIGILSEMQRQAAVKEKGN